MGRSLIQRILVERWKFKFPGRDVEVSDVDVSLQDCFLLTKDVYHNLHSFPCRPTFHDASIIRLSYMGSMMGSERLTAFALLHLLHTDILSCHVDLQL